MITLFEMSCISIKLWLLDFYSKTYIKPQNDYHELAQFLTVEEGKITFPTTIIIGVDQSLEKRIVGVAQKQDLLP